MKIISCTRTLNEERHIEKFCESYQNIADEILIADGGSTDNTIELAEKFPKTKAINFPIKVECKNGIWRNPDGIHIQFLVDHAVEDGADWIIFQDTDMRPNKYLKEQARALIEMADGLGKDFLMLTQIFIWQNTQYFPNMSFQGGRWMQGLWAWRANIGLKIMNNMPHFEFSYDGVKSIDINKTNKELAVQPPPCYMHYGWEDLEKINEHVEYYRKSGLISNMAHPLDFAGTLKSIEDWMIE